MTKIRWPFETMKLTELAAAEMGTGPNTAKDADGGGLTKRKDGKETSFAEDQ